MPSEIPVERPAPRQMFDPLRRALPLRMQPRPLRALGGGASATRRRPPSLQGADGAASAIRQRREPTHQPRAAGAPLGTGRPQQHRLRLRTAGGGSSPARNPRPAIAAARDIADRRDLCKSLRPSCASAARRRTSSPRPAARTPPVAQRAGTRRAAPLTPAAAAEATAATNKIRVSSLGARRPRRFPGPFFYGGVSRGCGPAPLFV